LLHQVEELLVLQDVNSELEKAIFEDVLGPTRHPDDLFARPGGWILTRFGFARVPGARGLKDPRRSRVLGQPGDMGRVDPAVVHVGVTD